MSGVPAVLLVDADPTARKAAAAALPPERYRLVYAASSDAALHLLEAESVSVIVCELVLPGPSGLSTLVDARRARPDVARIVLTAAAELDAAVQAINEAEVLRFLHKPVEPAELRAAIDDAIAWTQAAGRTAAARASAERRHVEIESLTAAHPGLLPASAGPDGYAIPPRRLAALAARLASTALGPVLAAVEPQPPPD